MMISEPRGVLFDFDDFSYTIIILNLNNIKLAEKKVSVQRLLVTKDWNWGYQIKKLRQI